MARMDKTQLKAVWRERLADWEQSGQSIPAFCRQRHLCTWSLYQWRKRLGVTPVQKPVQKAMTRFVEMKLPSASASVWPCELELNNGRKLRFQDGIAARQLAEWAAALEGGAC